MRTAAFCFFFLIFGFQAKAEESLRSKLFGFETYVVYGANMEPTIHKDELVWVDTTAFHSAGPTRGTLIAYRAERLKNSILVMRVVAVAGDTVEIDEGRLLVNGVVVEESYVDERLAKAPYSRRFGRLLIPNDSVFVLGDHRDNSNDSRFLGPVRVSAIIGRVTEAKESWLKGEFREVH